MHVPYAAFPLLIVHWMILFRFDEDKFILRFHKTHSAKLWSRLAIDSPCVALNLQFSCWKVCCAIIYDWRLKGSDYVTTKWFSSINFSESFSKLLRLLRKSLTFLVLTLCILFRWFIREATRRWHFPLLISFKLNRAAEIVFSSSPKCYSFEKLRALESNFPRESFRPTFFFP